MAQAGASLEWVQTEPRILMLAAVYGMLLAGGAVAFVGLFLRLVRRPVNWDECAGNIIARPLSNRFRLAYVGTVLFLWAAGATVAIMARQVSWIASNDAAESLIHGLFFQVIGLLTLAFCLRVRSLSWRNAFGTASFALTRQFAQAFVLYLASMPVVIAVGLISRLLFLRFGCRIEQQDVVSLFEQGLPFPALGAMLLLALIMAPVFEETLFRGIVLPLIARRFGLALAVFCTSLLFAAAHLNLASLPQLFVLAMAFSLAYVGTGSLLIPVIMHAIFNAVSLGLLRLAGME